MPFVLGLCLSYPTIKSFELSQISGTTKVLTPPKDIPVSLTRRFTKRSRPVTYYSPLQAGTNGIVPSVLRGLSLALYIVHYDEAFSKVTRSLSIRKRNGGQQPPRYLVRKVTLPVKLQ